MLRPCISDAYLPGCVLFGISASALSTGRTASWTCCCSRRRVSAPSRRTAWAPGEGSSWSPRWIWSRKSPTSAALSEEERQREEELDNLYHSITSASKQRDWSRLKRWNKIWFGRDFRFDFMLILNFVFFIGFYWICDLGHFVFHFSFDFIGNYWLNFHWLVSLIWSGLDFRFCSAVFLLVRWDLFRLNWLWILIWFVFLFVWLWFPNSSGCAFWIRLGFDFGLLLAVLLSVPLGFIW